MRIPRPTDALHEAMACVRTRGAAFNRIAVRDLAIFDEVPRLEDKPALTGAAPPAVFGVPIVIDETLEPDVIELRDGDRVVATHRLA